jgi:hypothetical protein
MHLVSRCLVNQQTTISANEARIRALHDAVGDSTSLSLNQWVHFHALALEYQPDLFVEIGRGYGNSTVAFVEALHHYNQDARVYSICISSSWDNETLPRLRNFLADEWFRPLEAPVIDIRDVNFAEVVGDAKRILVLWDAHGTEVADCVLSRLMPRVADREHFVVMHDISDGRHCGNPLSYQGKPFWRGQETGWSYDTARLRLGWIDTVVEQTIPAIDFLTRNELELGSADHFVKTEISRNPALLQRLRDSYPDGFFADINHWAFFTLNDSPGPNTFPGYQAEPGAPVELVPYPATKARAPVVPDPKFANPNIASNRPPTMTEQVAVDLRRSTMFGLRTPLTYARIFAKILAGRYAV